MNIELLWLIPAVAFAFFLFIVTFVAQRHIESRRKENTLCSEVASYNAGRHLGNAGVTLVPSAVEDTAENGDIKDKLRTVYKEYDILLSENYSLRAKVKQLSRQLKGGVAAQEEEDSPLTSNSPGRPSLHLYEDTRIISLASMDGDDQSETNDSVAR